MNFGKNIKVYRKLMGLSLRDFAKKTGFSHTYINLLEKGERTPSSNVIIKLAKALDIPANKLFQERSTFDSVAFDFRKKRLSKKKKDYIDLRLKQYASNIKDILDLSKYEANDPMLINYKTTISNYDEVKDIVARFRGFLGIEDDVPIDNLSKLLESRDVFISEINEDLPIDGACAVIDNLPLIVIKSQRTGDRQRFTLAHEIGHFLINSSNPDLNIEKAANKFASDLLLPKPLFDKYFNHPKNISFEELKYYKSYFKVSISAIIHRLYDLNYISESTKINYFKWAKSKGLFKEEPVPITPESFSLQKRLVHRLYSEALITERKAKQLLNGDLNFDSQKTIAA